MNGLSSTNTQDKLKLFQRLKSEVINVEGIEYDSCKRMKYHPEFHFSHGKRWEEWELEYICKFHFCDDLRTLGFALGKTETTVANQLTKLKKQGLFEHYKFLNKHFIGWE